MLELLNSCGTIGEARRSVTPNNSLASLLLISRAIKRVTISQRCRCFSFNVIVLMLWHADIFTEQ
jgi:hypothetical protein